MLLLMLPGEISKEIAGWKVDGSVMLGSTGCTKELPTESNFAAELSRRGE